MDVKNYARLCAAVAEIIYKIHPLPMPLGTLYQSLVGQTFGDIECTALTHELIVRTLIRSRYVEYKNGLLSGTDLMIEKFDQIMKERKEAKANASAS